MAPHTLTCVRSDEDAERFGGPDGLSYGPYDASDAVDAVFAYRKDPNAGWFRADGAMTFRVETPEGEPTMLSVDGRIVRDDTGAVVGGWGPKPKEVS